MLGNSLPSTSTLLPLPFMRGSVWLSRKSLKIYITLSEFSISRAMWCLVKGFRREKLHILKQSRFALAIAWPSLYPLPCPVTTFDFLPIPITPPFIPHLGGYAWGPSPANVWKFTFYSISMQSKKCGFWLRFSSYETTYTCLEHSRTADDCLRYNTH